jgi:hypothetical protein
MNQRLPELYVWDFTLTNKNEEDLNTLKAILISNCKNWAFQLEKGDQTGFIHWQGRLSLRKKKTQSSLISFFKNKEPFNLAHFSPTATDNSKSFNYVLKDDTRIDGPWSDKDEIKYETKQIKIFKKYELYPYQEKLKNMSTIFDMRSIDLIYDIVGNAGKSIFSEYLEYSGIAEAVPPFRLMDDIFQWVCSRPIKQCYIFDMPRGMKKDKLADFYAGIEVIKNGVAYDKRYNAKKIYFDRPRVFVFTNMLPCFDLMSKDRWNVWTLHNKDIKKMLIDDQLWDVE